MHVSLRNGDAAMSRDTHNREGIHARLSKPSQHCMAERVNYKVPAKTDIRPSLLVEMIDRGHEVTVAVAVSEHKLARGGLFALTEHL